jgi:hypothetical protein
MNLLFIGDIVGRPGRAAVQDWLPELREELTIDIVVANAENAAGGVGATGDIIDGLAALGVAAFTLGNHTWRRKAFIDEIGRYPQVVRPANYPENVPGQGWAAVALPDGRKLGLVSVLGRVFLDPFDCPFRAALEAVEALRAETDVILVDVHAEATSEKVAMGWYLDGRCSAVVGTHTHVQTADERILPGGTAYITDVGMTGPMDSVIGVDKDAVIERFLTGLPTDYRVAEGRPGLNGVYIEIDDETGGARSIARIQRVAH